MYERKEYYMAELNFDILNKNILSLMKNNNLTQNAFAERVGMKQSNISKALNSSEKKNFTIDQIYRIANEFNVTMDSLCGLNTEINDYKDIALFLTKLISSHICSVKEITVEETVTKEDWNDYGFYYAPEETTYLAIYFSNWWNLGEKDFSREEREEFDMEARSCGMDVPKNKKLNEFLNKYYKIYKINDRGELPEDAYRIILAGYLNELI